MTAVAGLRGTGDFSADERPKNFRELILWRDPNGSAPLTALMSKMRKETTDDPEFNWWEEEQKAVRIQVAAATTGETSVTVSVTGDATARDLVAGDLLLVEKAEATTFSFEIVEVSTTPTSSTTLALTRGAAGTTAATITSSSWLLKMGSAFGEGASSPAATSRNPTKYNNYTQIFKTAYNITNTNLATRARTGDVLKNDKKRKAFDHAVAQEWAAFLGRPYETTDAAGEVKRYTGGLFYYLGLNYNATTKPTIATLSSASLSPDTLLDGVYGIWDYNVPESGNERIAFCGNGFLNYVNKMIRTDTSSRITFDGVIKMYGMELMTLRFPQGTIYLKTHPLMSTNTFFTNGCFIINPPGIRYRPLVGRDTKLDEGPNGKGIQLPDADQKKGQWITEGGFEFNHLRSMRYLAIR